MFTPTQEQVEIVEAIGSTQKVKVSARAGAAKTTTLTLAANAYKVPSLYIAYNKHMADEARSKFPAHVEVRTAHSYAYRSHADSIKHKLVRIPGVGGKYNNVCGTGSEVARYFKVAPFVVTDSRSVTSAAMGYAILSTVSNFEYSGDMEIKEKHVSFREAEKVLKLDSFDRKTYAQRVLKYARQLWDLRKDPKSDIKITHDTYLKLWQLSKPNFDQYEIVYVDEFQDMNGCLLDVILNHKGKVVGVGDDHQSIYGWRGSLNAMQICDWPEYSLSKSFRFGQEIAEVAKDILLDSSGNRTLKFFGNEDISTKIVDKIDGSPYTIIFRTNALLIETALTLILEGKNVNMSIDVSDFKAMMSSTLALSRGDMKSVKHQSLVPYVNWSELLSEVDASSDQELKRVVKFIKDGRYDEIMNALEGYRPSKNPDVRLITAHGSKGLEFDNVELAEDFLPHETDERGNWAGFVGQEQNLLYVAATRAKKSLKINSPIIGVKGYTLSNVNIFHLEPGFESNVVSDLLNSSDHAVAAQEQMDLMSPFDDEYENSHNVDGSLRLLSAFGGNYA